MILWSISLVSLATCTILVMEFGKALTVLVFIVAALEFVSTASPKEFRVFDKVVRYLTIIFKVFFYLQVFLVSPESLSYSNRRIFAMPWQCAPVTV